MHALLGNKTLRGSKISRVSQVLTKRNGVDLVRNKDRTGSPRKSSVRRTTNHDNAAIVAALSLQVYLISAYSAVSTSPSRSSSWGAAS